VTYGRNGDCSGRGVPLGHQNETGHAAQAGVCLRWRIFVIKSHLIRALTAGASALALAAFAATPILAQGAGCSSLPSQSDLVNALKAAVDTEGSGLDFDMWATVVDRDGVVCAVAFSGDNRGDQWPGSRVISAQKANTANAFSLKGLALSTANLYSAVQPGGSLFGLQESNPVATDVAYKGPSLFYGTIKDPMVGSKIGGVNVFGGGLALYGPGGQLLGAVGVSGDTSCADHMIGWRVRNNLGLDHLGTVGGVAGQPRPDNIIYDIAGGVSTSGFGHPECINTADPATLPVVQP
jgi:uncharacterized protein GlcG (DUF336 family)